MAKYTHKELAKKCLKHKRHIKWFRKQHFKAKYAWSSIYTMAHSSGPWAYEPEPHSMSEEEMDKTMSYNMNK